MIRQRKKEEILREIFSVFVQWNACAWLAKSNVMSSILLLKTVYNKFKIQQTKHRLKQIIYFKRHQQTALRDSSAYEPLPSTINLLIAGVLSTITGHSDQPKNEPAIYRKSLPSNVTEADVNEIPSQTSTRETSTRDLYKATSGHKFWTFFFLRRSIINPRMLSQEIV